jgi:hypothetical protein
VNERLRVEDPDGMYEEHKRFILVRVEERPTSSGESLVLSCTEVLVVGGYKQVREGGAARSQDV